MAKKEKKPKEKKSKEKKPKKEKKSKGEKEKKNKDERTHEQRDCNEETVHLVGDLRLVNNILQRVGPRYDSLTPCIGPIWRNLRGREEVHKVQLYERRG